MIREQLSLFPPFAASLYSPPKDSNFRKLPKTGSRREAVLRQIIKANKRGLTDEELNARLVLTAEQVRRARAELLEGGFVQDSTTRRQTAFGDAAIVWRATDLAVQEWKSSGRK